MFDRSRQTKEFARGGGMCRSDAQIVKKRKYRPILTGLTAKDHHSVSRQHVGENKGKKSLLCQHRGMKWSYKSHRHLTFSFPNVINKKIPPPLRPSSSNMRPPPHVWTTWWMGNAQHAAAVQWSLLLKPDMFFYSFQIRKRDDYNLPIH